MAWFVAALVVISPFSVRADEVQPRTITTTGEGVVFVVPDEAILNIGIDNMNKDLDQAKAANEQASRRLVEAIRAMGIDEKDIAAGALDVRLQSNERDRPGVIDGYFISRSYTIKLKDVKNLEKLVDASLRNGANRIDGFQFHTSDLRKYRDQARELAVKLAKEKAVDMANALDCKVGKPRTITESNGGYYSPYSNYAAAQVAAEASPGASDADSDLPRGQIEVRASVSVTFELE